MIGLLVVFLIGILIVGYVHKSGAERDARNRKLAAIQRRLAEKERERQAAENTED